MISSSLPRPGSSGETSNDAVVDCHVETERRGPGKVDHKLVLEASELGNTLWRKEIIFWIDAPFDVPDLQNLDPFAIAALFPTMEVGGTLRVHGAVSRTLMRNILDYQTVWSLAAPDLFRPFVLEVEAIDDSECKPPASRPRTMLAFTAGVDSMLALCRNASGDAGEAGYDIAATMMIRGMGVAPGNERDPAELTEDLRQISGRWNVPLAVIDTNIYEVIDKPLATYGTWLASCLSVFSGAFDVGLVGSSKVWYSPGWEISGSHPLVDPILSSGQMTIRNDEGLFGRGEKAALLARYPSALEDLRVCFNAKKDLPNCGRCEKCVRTMLCFAASGNEVPPAFPNQLRLEDVGSGMRKETGLQWGPQILDCARQFGTLDHPAIRVFRQRYRRKLLKFVVKNWFRRTFAGHRPPRLHVLDGLDPIINRAISRSRAPTGDDG
ncbi:MAG: hypothetical protein AAF414_16795 [Pseudomonadota bacterium]